MRFKHAHPWVQVLLFLSILIITMSCYHPMILSFSFIGGVWMQLRIYHIRKVLHQLLLLLPIAALGTVVNVLFNHRGMTRIGTFQDNPITVESLVFGLTVSILLVDVLLWLRLLREYLKLDRLLYLTGSSFPYLTLLLSMSFRMVDRLRVQGTRMFRVQSILHGKQKHKREQIRIATRVMSGLTGQTLEDSLDTSASMKARGYGLGRRTNYSNYRMRVTNVAQLIAILLLFSSCLFGLYGPGREMLFYPRVYVPTADLRMLVGWFGFASLCLMPVLMDWLGGLRWKNFK